MFVIREKLYAHPVFLNLEDVSSFKTW